MSSKTRILLKTHLRIAKNWMSSWMNVFFLVLVASLSILVMALFEQRLARNAANFVVQAGGGVIILMVPVVLSKLYLNLLQRENRLLLTMMSGDELARIRRMQAVATSTVLFILLSTFGLYPRIEGLSRIVMIPAGVLLLAVIGISMGYGGAAKKQQSVIIEGNRMRMLNPSGREPSPVRAIICRDILSIWRQKRIALFLYVLSLAVINAICIAFSIKNNIRDLYIGSLIVQAIMILDVALNYSIEDDKTLLSVNDSYARDLYKSKVLFWLIACTLYFCVIIPIHYALLPGFSPVFSAFFGVAVLLLLAYALLVRIAYCESNIARNVVMVFSIAVPISIPFFIYRFRRRLSC